MTVKVGVDPLSILRARGGLFVAPEGVSGRSLILDQKTGTYIAVPHSGRLLLEDLSRRPLGMTIPEAMARYALADVEQVVELNLVHLIPPLGIPPKRALILEFAITNVRARLRFAAIGWRAISDWMDRSPIRDTQGPLYRPLFFDEVEIAAQRAFAIPGTHRVCTVVAITCAMMLRRRGFHPSVVVMTDSDQVNPHAFVTVGGHRIDPSEEQVSGPILRQLG